MLRDTVTVSTSNSVFSKFQPWTWRKLSRVPVNQSNILAEELLRPFSKLELVWEVIPIPPIGTYGKLFGVEGDQKTFLISSVASPRRLRRFLKSIGWTEKPVEDVPPCYAYVREADSN